MFQTYGVAVDRNVIFSGTGGSIYLDGLMIAELDDKGPLTYLSRKSLGLVSAKNSQSGQSGLGICARCLSMAVGEPVGPQLSFSCHSYASHFPVGMRKPDECNIRDSSETHQTMV